MRTASWHIDRPNFSRKEGKRIFWKSRIELDVKAGIVTSDDEKQITVYQSPFGTQVTPHQKETSYVSSYGTFGEPIIYGSSFLNLAEPEGTAWRRGVFNTLPTYPLQKRVISHKGVDIFEVLWSTEVTMSRELRKPKIEGITHVELSCQPLGSGG